MSDRVKKLLLMSLSFGTTVVLIGLSIWWVPTLYDDKPTASFTWASEPEDTGGSNSNGSYVNGNSAPGDKDDTTESPGPVGSGDSGNQSDSGGSAGNGESDNGEAGGNGGQGGSNGNGGSTNGTTSGSGNNKPGQSGGNVTSSKPGKPATSSGGGSSGTPGGENNGPLTPEEKSWFHNDLTDEQNAVALNQARLYIKRAGKNPTTWEIIRSAFRDIHNARRYPDCSLEYTEAYHFVTGYFNDATQISMFRLVLSILGIESEHHNDGLPTHQWVYFTFEGKRYSADFAQNEISEVAN